MGETSQAATKLRRGSPVSDGKPGISYTRAIEFAAPPRAKRRKTNFTRKDSLPVSYAFGCADKRFMRLEK
jgi:hypothetical protein